MKSRTAFREYWGNPESTAKAFADGWFLTGDIAVVDEGAYRILGRASIDIIKSGGYKLSALEIEATLLEHPDVSEVAVIGVPDDEWGEIVAAAVVLANSVSEDDLVQWSRERMRAIRFLESGFSPMPCRATRSVRSPSHRSVRGLRVDLPWLPSRLTESNCHAAQDHSHRR